MLSLFSIFLRKKRYFLAIIVFFSLFLSNSLMAKDASALSALGSLSQPNGSQALLLRDAAGGLYLLGTPQRFDWQSLADSPTRRLTAGKADAASLAQASNLSTRGFIGSGSEAMIAGFVLSGAGQRQILVRVGGPALAAAGVPGALSDPKLSFYNGQELVAENDDWISSDTATREAILATGLAPANALEPALLLNIGQGAYTAIVEGVGGETGLGIVEVYVVDDGTATPDDGTDTPDDGADTPDDGADTPDDGTDTPALDAEQQQLLDLVNNARAQGQDCGIMGVFPPAAAVVWNTQAEQAAQRHSDDMANNDFFDHTGSDGTTVGDRLTATGYQWQTVGENIAAGFFSAEAVVQAWIDSDGHCANLMNANFRDMGIAKTERSGTGFTVYWTQVLAAGF
jgi:uncharacterized protein YkwD